MKALKILVIASVFALLAACRAGAPIYNVTGVNVVAEAGKPVTAEQVKTAIFRGAQTLGWKIEDKGPGQLQGMLMLRTHTAIVDIMYDEKAYSIKYNNSTNLDYKNGTIHKNYNGWIQNLEKAINVQLRTL